jgi:hypothetical protein
MPSQCYNCGDASSSDSTFGLFSSLTVYGASAMTMGDVRVYLIDYIFCIINCHICWNTFDKIDIMYFRLSYIFGDALSLKTHFIYTDRET